MPVDAWIIAGLVVGFIASRIVLQTGEGLPRDLGLGVLGAVAAGALFNHAFDVDEGTGPGILGLAVTLAGASAVLVVWHRFIFLVRGS